MDILFYHMQNTTLEQVLPVLLLKVLQRNWKANIRFTTLDRMQSIDAVLWTFREDSFLPHGSDNDEHKEMQPIFLTISNDNINQSNVLFLTDRATPDNIDGYERVVLIFDGNDNEVLAETREYWKKLKNLGHDCTYWQQNQTGRWEQKA